jgi:hypothetical protein
MVPACFFNPEWFAGIINQFYFAGIFRGDFPNDRDRARHGFDYLFII